MDQVDRNQALPRVSSVPKDARALQAVDRAIDVLEMLADDGDMAQNDQRTQEWTIGASAFRIGANLLPLTPRHT